MAKIDRKTQKIFGEGAGGTGITEYGSPAGGSPVYSTDLDAIQTAAWLIGWSAAALAGDEIPTFQDFNAIHFVATNQIGYLLQEGIAEYDTGTTYFEEGIVKKTGTFELYGSLIDTNLGNALPAQVDDANWKYLGNLADLVTAGNTGPFSEEFNSSEQTITSGGGLTIAHGLSSAPKFIQADLVCKVADGNYSIGDVVYYSVSGGNGDTGSSDKDRNFVAFADATNIGIRFGAEATNNTIRILNKTTGVIFSITDASWKLVLNAYA